MTIFAEVTENECINVKHSLSKVIDSYCAVTGKRREIGCQLVLVCRVRAFD